ncbi:MAG: SDR family oxidoreductase [Candidatus Omnitrophota bacterium]|nr:SDR family oxidoreductase [Candidatus Omnitrophota bacterium]
MSRFLVTGGAGFIGSHIVQELVKRKHFVRVLDNFSSGKQENLSFFTHEAGGNILRPRLRQAQYELIRGDIRDKSTCDSACCGIDYVLHQAALRSVPKSMKYPREYNEVNINGTLNMLEASLKNKVRRFVFASSSSVYGDTNVFPEKEGYFPCPISPYALTKLTGEYYCKIFSLHYGLSAVSLRYFNVFGERQSLDDEYAVVIPKFINCMLKGEQPPIFGTGRQSRDFTYVGNVVSANILAANKNGLRGEVFNVASGKDYTILELVSILNKILKKNIRPVFLNPRPGDVFRTLSDLTRVKRILGYKPRIDFIPGLKQTVEYFSRGARAANKDA